jgi:hypothetical protein
MEWLSDVSAANSQIADVISLLHLTYNSMRDKMQMFDDFIPENEKDYDGRLFVDNAVKQNAAHQLETIARALSGKYPIEIQPCKDEPFENRYYVKADDGTWPTQTVKYKFRGKMGSFHFYAQTRAGIYLAVIKFWIEDVVMFPCGAASIQNPKAIAD